MGKKIRVGILFGGKSAEHEVSLQSAKNVVDAIDKKIFDVTLIGVTKKGKWLLSDQSEFLLNSGDPKLIKLNQSSDSVALIPQSEGELSNLSNSEISNSVDVVFPILHGPFGEDGTVQGLLKLANIPFVGADVLGSAVGMDKDIMKRLLRDAGVPIADFFVVNIGEEYSYEDIVNKLGNPLFIKPANMGSSVGVNKSTNEEEFKKALKDAFKYDTKVIIEEFIDGREIECAVLGNEYPEASIPGEVIVHDEFYSYETKYVDENGATLQIPAKLSEKEVEDVQKLAVKVFKTLACEGLARVDFFLKKDGSFVLNEINTMPGFTSISMYPMLWKESGVPYMELITRLIKLAIERFEKKSKLKTEY